MVLLRDVPVTYPKPATFKLADSGARPVLVVEVTSDDTRGNDLGVKKGFYHRARVEVYVIVDARQLTDEVRQVRLLGFRHTPERYEPIPLDDQGRLWVEPAGL